MRQRDELARTTPNKVETDNNNVIKTIRESNGGLPLMHTYMHARMK